MGPLSEEWRRYPDHFVQPVARDTVQKARILASYRLRRSTRTEAPQDPDIQGRRQNGQQHTVLADWVANRVGPHQHVGLLAPSGAGTVRQLLGLCQTVLRGLQQWVRP